jgi:hypothetical protein
MKAGMLFFTFILVAFLLPACAVKKEAIEPRLEKEIKTVSVKSFECEDPGISNVIRIKIIEALLNNYEVVIGGEADAEVGGVITLAGKETIEKYISGIRADIMKDNKILSSINVAQNMDSGVYSTVDDMGRKIAQKIIRALLGYNK